jgi:RNA polymerase sigma factor (sigma-70 family)
MHHLLATLLRRLTPPDDPSSDATLLFRFVQHRDQTAFELLVWRHGGLVLGVCRRMLRDDHAAEDAFQATFLILARKAGSVRGSLAGWLHQVARRVCLKVRRANPVPLEPGSDRPAAESADPLLAGELRAVLDEEIARLPEKQRLAVLLCYLQGRTTDDAAKYLGLPQGTVLSRLDAARKRLRSALTRRGMTVPATLFAIALGTPDLPADVCRRTTAAALDFLTTTSLETIPSQLAHEVTQMTARKTALGMAAAIVLTAGVGTGVGLVMAQGGKTPATKVADKPAAEQKPEQKIEDERQQARRRKAEEEERQRKMRDERLKRLSAWQQEVTQQIVQFEQQRQKVVVNTGGDVDPSVLEAKLGGIDKSIVGLEDQIASRPDAIKASENQLEEVKADRFGNEQWAVEEVARRVNSTKEVTVATSLLQRRNMDVSELSKKTSPDSELLKEAQKLVKTAVADLEKAREQVRPKVETDFKNEQVKRAESNVTAQKVMLKEQTAELKSFRAKRIDLVTRIQRAKAAQSAQQLIDDEIQVLREIRKQVLRERLMLEMGLDERK